MPKKIKQRASDSDLKPFLFNTIPMKAQHAYFYSGYYFYFFFGREGGIAMQ